MRSGLSLTLLPAFGTHSFYWIASSSLNRRGGARPHGWLISMGGPPVSEKNSRGGVDEWGGGGEKNWENEREGNLWDVKTKNR